MDKKHSAAFLDELTTLVKKYRLRVDYWDEGLFLRPLAAENIGKYCLNDVDNGEADFRWESDPAYFPENQSQNT